MRRIIALCALLACIPASAQQIYRWVDADGRVRYTTEKPPSGVKASVVESRINCRRRATSTSAWARAAFR
jgi:hypothetical protein